MNHDGLTTLLACTIASFALDQVSKTIALGFHRDPESALPRRSLLRCTLNTKVARGIRARSGVMITLWCGELAALLLLVTFVPAFGGLLSSAALGLALGGAAGNLLDLVQLGGVVDFIDLGFWPVFNLADVAIVAGVLIAMTSVI
jgi:signal peptidase II